MYGRTYTTVKSYLVLLCSSINSQGGSRICGNTRRGIVERLQGWMHQTNFSSKRRQAVFPGGVFRAEQRTRETTTAWERVDSSSRQLTTAAVRVRFSFDGPWGEKRAFCLSVTGFWSACCSTALFCPCWAIELKTNAHCCCLSFVVARYCCLHLSHCRRLSPPLFCSELSSGRNTMKQTYAWVWATIPGMHKK